MEVTGNCQSDYTAEETPMVSYGNLHFALENLRDAALEGNTMGPRVLVVGPENAGKTSLVKILAAYATRSERQPIVVNLDPKEGLLSVPGTLSTVVLDSVIDVEEGWGSSPTNGPSQIPVKLPLVYYYGMEDPEAHGELYKPLVTRLALSVMNRLEEDREAKASGCFVDTSGSVSMGKAGYDMIHHMVAEFSSTEAPPVSLCCHGTLNADKLQLTSSSSSDLSAFIATCHGASPNKVLVIAVPSQSSNLTSLAVVSTATANICSSSDKPKSESTSLVMSEPH
jgi:energy-coupling factor transporter ATP-binding protein EcfA2